jgi:hypothetical protein
VFGAGAVTIGFSWLFGTQNAWAQALMIAALPFTIGVVLLSIVALDYPFAGVTRIEPGAFRHVARSSSPSSSTSPGACRGRVVSQAPS